MKPRRIIIILGLVALALLLPILQVCRDWAFIDQNTGARQGYREWVWGSRTGLWYRTSALETFMRASYPGEFRQQWVSCAGTGRNVFGFATMYGHGSPGPVIALLPEVIDDYCNLASDDEKRRLYDVFSSGQRARVQALVEQITDALIDAPPRKPAQSEPPSATRPTGSETDQPSPTNSHH